MPVPVFVSANSKRNMYCSLVSDAEVSSGADQPWEPIAFPGRGATGGGELLAAVQLDPLLQHRLRYLCTSTHRDIAIPCILLDIA